MSEPMMRCEACPNCQESERIRYFLPETLTMWTCRNCAFSSRPRPATTPACPMCHVDRIERIDATIPRTDFCLCRSCGQEYRSGSLEEKAPTVEEIRRVMGW